MARLQQDHFQIFISHKHDDREVAETIRRELEELSPLIKCWVSGSEIVAASDWRREIHHGLGQSHLLLLLFTTPAHNWDWCLYEVGLFMRFEETAARAVVCLFDPRGESPGPLANVQGVPAEAGRMRDTLLRPLLAETWRVSDDWLKGPLVPEPRDEDIDRAADAIAKAFAGALGSDAYYPCHRLILDLRDVAVDVDGGIPEKAVVKAGYGATTGYTLSLFGRAEGPSPRTWGDIVHAVGGEHAAWRRKLDQQFAAACREELFDPLIEPFPTWSRDRLYRPILTQVRRRSGSREPEELTLLLVRDLAPPLVGGPEFNLVRSNARFRSEVFDEYQGDLSAQLAESGSAVYRAIRGAFERVEREAEALGVFTEAQVRSAYGDDYDPDALQDLGANWTSARRRLYRALDDQDRAATVEQLAQLSDLNRRFMALAVGRYCKVLTEER